MTQGKKIVQIWKDILGICFFTRFLVPEAFLDLYHSPHHLWILITCSNVLYLVFRGPVPEMSFIFFRSLRLD